MSNIEANLRTRYGYGAAKDITKPKGQVPLDDSMESFFLAETLKYHFLLQSEEIIIDLNDWVFNTEAHPMKVFK